MFFKLLRDRWAKAVMNVVDYFRELTLSTNQCGFCSYQHSCGRRCHRRTATMNPLFVAERHCDGVDQSAACVSRTNGAAECQLWPNRQIALPNVSDWMASMLGAAQFVNCVPQTNSSHPSPQVSAVMGLTPHRRMSPPPSLCSDHGVRLCRCCCAPYAPNPAASFRCELMPMMMPNASSSPPPLQQFPSQEDPSQN